jgi:hypothetical protein
MVRLGRRKVDEIQQKFDEWHAGNPNGSRLDAARQPEAVAIGEDFEKFRRLHDITHRYTGVLDAIYDRYVGI